MENEFEIKDGVLVRYNGNGGDVVIPEGVTKIGYHAFENCSPLTSVTIPNGVAEIGEGAFYECTSLKSVAIPQSVAKIGGWAFYECTSLESVAIPPSVKEIEDFAFYWCAFAEDFKAEIAHWRFESCVAIKDGVVMYLANKFAKNVVIPQGATEIFKLAFDNIDLAGNNKRHSIESVVIPEGVVRIGANAFMGCHELKSVVIPKSLKEIDANAFLGCDKLDLYGIVKQNALFIHGFGGSGESSTGKCVEKALCENYDFIKPDFDLTDVNGTLYEIRKIIKSKDIKLIAGTSLGAFYTLACGFNDRCIRRIAVNPCMKPSEEIPKLKDFETGRPVEMPEETLELWRKMEEETYKENVAKNVTGLFADKDELFGSKYHELFAKCYGAQSVHIFEGGHHGGGEKLTQAVGGIYSANNARHSK